METSICTWSAETWIPNSLYENQGDGTFLDTTEEVTPVITHKGSGPAFGDIDGDGDLDLFLGAVDGSRYYVLENRDGAFFDETGGSGIALTAPNTVSATFFDYDSDGHLDLFLSHWGVSRESGADTETVWRNRGDGTFGSASVETGIAAQGSSKAKRIRLSRPTWAISTATVTATCSSTADNGHSQGLPEQRRRDLRPGPRTGTSSPTRPDQGAAFWPTTTTTATSTGSSHRTTTSTSRTAIASAIASTGIRRGRSEFEDATDAAGVADGGWGWGTCAADFDNDGNLDIFQVNGWGEELGKDFGDDPVRLFYSQGDGTFEERAADFGLDDAGQGRGVACFDAERDGDIDIVLTNASAGHIVYYRNDTDNDNHYLGVKVKALGANTFGVGALVEARTSDGVQVRTVGGSQQLRLTRSARSALRSGRGHDRRHSRGLAGR